MALVAIGRMTALAIASGVGLLLTGGLGAALVAIDGARGGAIAALMGESALAIVLVLMLTTAGPRHRIRTRIVWKVAAASLALVLVTEVIASPWLDVVAGTGVFMSLALVTRAIPSELVDAFRRSFRRGEARS